MIWSYIFNYIIISIAFICPCCANPIYTTTVSEFNEFEPRLKSTKNRVQLSAGLNLETWIYNFKWNQPYSSRDLNLSDQLGLINPYFKQFEKTDNLQLKFLYKSDIFTTGNHSELSELNTFRLKKNLKLRLQSLSVVIFSLPTVNVIQGTLVPKLTLGPFLTLSVRKSSKLSLSSVFMNI